MFKNGITKSLYKYETDTHELESSHIQKIFHKHTTHVAVWSFISLFLVIFVIFWKIYSIRSLVKLKDFKLFPK